VEDIYRAQQVTVMDNRIESTEHTPIQFGLGRLLQFVTIASLWCAIAIVRDNVVLGMAYTVVVVAATWIIAGRWAVTLSRNNCRRVLAGTTALLVAGGAGVTILVEDEDHFPIVWMLTGLLAALPWMVTNLDTVFRILVGVACNILFLLIIYRFWLAVFGSWDRLSERPDQRYLAKIFSILLSILGLPLALPILFSILGGFDADREYGDVNAIHHHWLHYVVHVGMLLAAGLNIWLLQRHARRSTDSPPDWLKLVTWGYLCAYAVLLQVALFPVEIYIP
jgi:hypothetical protein